MTKNKVFSNIIIGAAALFGWAWVSTVIFNVIFKFPTFLTVLCSGGVAIALALILAKNYNITLTRVVEG